jgi:hypothetical protein
VTADTTIISIKVKVPVLSEQIRETEPSVSTAGRRRTMAWRWAMRCTPIASVMVMSAGKPSGINETAMPVTAWNSSTNGMPVTHLP